MTEQLYDRRKNIPIFIHSSIDDMTDLSPNAMRVYMHLARRANKEGCAWPSYQSIGDHCFASVSDNKATRKSFARKAVDDLIAAKLLAKEARHLPDGKTTSNVYILLDPEEAQDEGGVLNRHDPCLIGTAVLNRHDPCLLSTKGIPVEGTPIEGIPMMYEGPAASPPSSLSKLDREKMFARLQSEWPLGVGGTQIEAHSELVELYGIDAWRNGFDRAKPGARANKNYVMKCIISAMDDNNVEDRQTKIDRMVVEAAQGIVSPVHAAAQARREQIRNGEI